MPNGTVIHHITVRKIGVEETVAHYKRNNDIPAEQHDPLLNWAFWIEALAVGEEVWVIRACEGLLGRKLKGIADMKDDLFAPDIPPGGNSRTSFSAKLAWHYTKKRGYFHVSLNNSILGYEIY